MNHDPRTPARPFGIEFLETMEAPGLHGGTTSPLLTNQLTRGGADVNYEAADADL